MNDTKRMKRIINAGFKAYKKLDDYNSNSDVLEGICECSDCPFKKSNMTYEKWKNKMDRLLRNASINKYNLLYLLQCGLKNAQIWEETIKIVIIPIYLILLFGDDSLFQALNSNSLISAPVFVILEILILLAIMIFSIVMLAITKNRFNYYKELIEMVKKYIPE